MNCVELRSHGNTHARASPNNASAAELQTVEKLKVKASSVITPHIVVLIAFPGGCQSLSTPQLNASLLSELTISKVLKWYRADGTARRYGETSTEGCHKIILTKCF